MNLLLVLLLNDWENIRRNGFMEIRWAWKCSFVRIFEIQVDTASRQSSEVEFCMQPIIRILFELNGAKSWESMILKVNVCFKAEGLNQNRTLHTYLHRCWRKIVDGFWV